MTRPIIACVLLLWAVPARAQSIEVAALFGYATASEIDQKTANVDDLTITGGLAWAVSGTYFLTEHFGVEGWYSQHPTSVRIAAGDAGADLFDMKISQALGNLVFQPFERSASLQPFITVGAGATMFSADDFAGESKFAFSVGGGLKWLLSPRIGARVNARFAGTALNDASSTVCDPFGFCQSSQTHFEITGGVVLRF